MTMHWCFTMRIKPGSAYENTWIYYITIVISLLHVSVAVIIMYLVECKIRFFPEIWHLIKWGCLKFAYEVPNWTEPNWISLNQTMHNQPRPILPNTQVRSAVFLNIMQCTVAIPYQHFGTTSLSHLWRSTNQKEGTEHDWC